MYWQLVIAILLLCFGVAIGSESVYHWMRATNGYGIRFQLIAYVVSLTGAVFAIATGIWLMMHL